MPNGTWLRNLRAVEKDKGVDYRTLACEAAVLTPYVRDRLSRAAFQIEELYNQLPSKIVPEEQQRENWENGREAYVARVCEAIQLLGSALAAVGCTDAELIGILSCEEDGEEAKRDIPLPVSEDVENDTPEDECDSSKTIVMDLPAEARTEVHETVK